MMEGEGIEWRDTGLIEFIKSVSNLDQTRIKIGIVPPHSDEMSADGRLKLGELAIILEYGTRNIPLRPFINGVISPNQALTESRRVAEAILRREHADHALREAGRKFVAQLRDHAELGHLARNAASTVKKKGFDHPLVDTLKMISAIDYVLVHEGGASLEGGLDVENPGGLGPVAT